MDKNCMERLAQVNERGSKNKTTNFVANEIRV